MVAKRKGKENWFESLDRELEEQTKEIIESFGEQNTQKLEVNRSLIEDFWKIWKRFNKINVHFTIDPSYTAFAQFDEFPYGEWKWRTSFNVAGVNRIELVDRTQDQGRIGDAMRVSYYAENNKPKVRIDFQYCEGEHYYKYSGWKRIYSQHLLYDEPLEKVDMGDVHGVFKDIVKTWYESHLKRNRSILLNHLKSKYPNMETFTQ
ncbi:MAG: hypothetical protein LN416_04240 [Candidatus Thermoplasmatota archaeon]|nr:hypothetical protein [Candidatus Thermoplasmatota archaeon]